MIDHCKCGTNQKLKFPPKLGTVQWPFFKKRSPMFKDGDVNCKICGKYVGYIRTGIFVPYIPLMSTPTL